MKNTLEVTKLILDLHKNDVSNEEIANRTGKTISAVRMIINNYHVWQKKPDTYYICKKQREIFQRYTENLKLIAKEEQPDKPPMYNFDNLPVLQDPTDPLFAAELKLREVLVEIAEVFVQEEKKKMKEYYEKQIDVLSKENKKIHKTLEEIQKQSIIGMLKSRFEAKKEDL